MRVCVLLGYWLPYCTCSLHFITYFSFGTFRFEDFEGVAQTHTFCLCLKLLTECSHYVLALHTLLELIAGGQWSPTHSSGTQKTDYSHPLENCHIMYPFCPVLYKVSVTCKDATQSSQCIFNIQGCQPSQSTQACSCTIMVRMDNKCP